MFRKCADAQESLHPLRSKHGDHITVKLVLSRFPKNGILNEEVQGGVVSGSGS